MIEEPSREIWRLLTWTVIEKVRLAIQVGRSLRRRICIADVIHEDIQLHLSKRRKKSSATSQSTRLEDGKDRDNHGDAAQTTRNGVTKHRLRARDVEYSFEASWKSELVLMHPLSS